MKDSVSVGTINKPKTDEIPGMRETKLAKRKLPRLFWVTLAALCFAIAIVGIFLPLLPTTDFMLLAVICASKGSKRFERWIRNNRLAGPMIYAWESERAIPLKAKCLSITTLIASIIIIYVHVHFHWLLWLALAILIPVGIYIATRPTPTGTWQREMPLEKPPK